MNKQSNTSPKQAMQKHSHQQQDEKTMTQTFSPQCSSRYSQNAFDPNYLKNDAIRPSSPTSCCSSGYYTQADTASSTTETKTVVDPLIVSFCQQGFPSSYDHEDHINNDSQCCPSAKWLLQDKENGFPQNIEYVIMDETLQESEIIPTTPKRSSRVGFLHLPSSNSSKNCHQQQPQDSPLTPPKMLTDHYGKAQVLAWRTQRASKAALRKALQHKHTWTAKAVALKSVEVVKEVSLRSVELARKHSPI